MNEQHVASSLQATVFDDFGAFAKLQKATVSFVMFVRPSFRMEQLGPHRTDFH
jgi:hypothetical protein